MAVVSDEADLVSLMNLFSPCPKGQAQLCGQQLLLHRADFHRHICLPGQEGIPWGGRQGAGLVSLLGQDGDAGQPRDPCLRAEAQGGVQPCEPHYSDTINTVWVKSGSSMGDSES